MEIIFYVEDRLRRIGIVCSSRGTNEEYIMNYFINGDTNALAEGFNSKIQRFITSNNGTKGIKTFSSLDLITIMPSTSK